MTPKTLQNQTSPNTTFLDHIQELRLRLIFYVLILLLASLVGYLIRDHLFVIVTQPLGQPLYYTSPAGGFNFIFSLSLLFGFLVSLPVLLFQIMLFVSPAFPNALNKILPYVLSSIFFMICGVAFAYFVSLPAALYFLNNFSSDAVVSLISTDSYVSFVTRYVLGFAIVFQLPVFMLLLNKIVPLNIKSLLRMERWVIIGAFVVAALLTPTPDAINQLVMALPMILIYQISIFVVFITNKRSCTS